MKKAIAAVCMLLACFGLFAAAGQNGHGEGQCQDCADALAQSSHAVYPFFFFPTTPVTTVHRIPIPRITREDLLE